MGHSALQGTRVGIQSTQTPTHPEYENCLCVFMCVCVRVSRVGFRRCIDVLYPNDKPTGLMARHN